jgi:hypothetical protein
LDGSLWLTRQVKHRLNTLLKRHASAKHPKGNAAAPLNAAAHLLSTAGADYKFIGRRSTPGNDFPCGQKDDKGNLQPFCKICDGLGALADACDNNPE